MEVTWLRPPSWPFGLCPLLRAANATPDTCCFSTRDTDDWAFCPVSLFDGWFCFRFAFGLADFGKYQKQDSLNETSRSSQSGLVKTREDILQLYSSLFVVFTYWQYFKHKKHVLALKHHCEGHQTRITNMKACFPADIEHWTVIVQQYNQLTNNNNNNKSRR